MKAGYDKLRAANAGTKGTVTEIEVLRALYEWEKAKLQIEKAREKNIADKLKSKAKKAEVDAASVSASRRILSTPFDGVVTKIHRRVGEWVAPGEAVVQVVRVDRLRVSGELDATKWSPATIEGRSVTVEVSLPNDRTVKVPGKIVYVSPTVALGHDLPVYAEIDSPVEDGRRLVRAGQKARMTIHVNKPIEPDQASVTGPAKELSGPSLKASDADSKNLPKTPIKPASGTSGKAVSRTSNKPPLDGALDGAGKSGSKTAEATKAADVDGKAATDTKAASTKSPLTKNGDKPGSDKPGSDKAKSDKPSTEKSSSDKSSTDKPADKGVSKK